MHPEGPSIICLMGSSWPHTTQLGSPSGRAPFYPLSILDLSWSSGSGDAILIPSDQYTHLKEPLIPNSLHCSG